ncbi:type II restriction endonuclease [Moraxella nasovis]|uniref:type II restriction endonuclease n=1 Tax=Moraxella nasovis TaxID=2904121 RepID=UPI001F611EE1|nr:type II restriction endonuclease [Moraxella nasovis]UNU73328.1 type II restriction endonuclease [Moraxella nasovis]
MKDIYDSAHFDLLISTLKEKGLIQYDYFVNWAKVFDNITPIEKELNLLNTAIGKDNVDEVLFDIFKTYPKTIKVIPILLAIRDKSIEVLIDSSNFIYRNFNFNDKNIDDDKIHGLIELLLQSGFVELIKNKQIKNLVDYCIGVEVGLDSNGRKNRSGTSMEILVESFVALFCHNHNLEYLVQANAKKIADAWGIEIQIDKTSRIIDFVIKNGEKLYFIECNFYKGGGSKLKSTATEYIEMARFWKNQDIEFIWVTDGAGWAGTHRPLRDYFNKGNILLNIQMLQDDYLAKIILDN